jgi:putative tryptophan/tyrosine transport system substrate-binding protein
VAPDRTRRTRRHFLRGGLALAGLGLLAGCGLSPPSGQPAAGRTKVRLIGVIGDAPAPRWDAFREGLRELGWVEGHNLAVEYRWAEGNTERNRAFADELVRLKVELIVGGP